MTDGIGGRKNGVAVGTSGRERVGACTALKKNPLVNRLGKGRHGKARSAKYHGSTSKPERAGDGPFSGSTCEELGTSTGPKVSGDGMY